MQFLVFLQSHLYDADRHDWFVPVVGRNLGDPVDDVETLYSLTIDSVGSVKLGTGLFILDNVELGS